MVSCIWCNRECFGCSFVNLCCSCRCDLSTITCCCCNCELSLDVSNLCCDLSFLRIYICLRACCCQLLSCIYKFLKLYKCRCRIFIFICCIEDCLCICDRCLKFCKVSFVCCLCKYNSKFVELWTFTCIRCCKNKCSCSGFCYFDRKSKCLYCQ